MASVKVVERVALYDNSKKDQQGKECFRRLPWNLVTLEPGTSGSPRTTFLEPMNVNAQISPIDFKTVDPHYHRVDIVDATRYYGFNERNGTGGENRANKV